MKNSRITKIQKLMIFIIILLIITIVFLVYNIKNFKQEEEIIIERYYYSETVVPSYIDGITITTHFLNKSSDRRPSEHRLIKYIVVHETDNRNIGTGALKHSQYLTSNSDNINGWHYTVDDHIIYHNIPDNEIAWHAGDGRSEDGGNMNGIGIEMAVNVDGDYDKTLENSVKLIVYLMHEYELDINDVKLHKDFSGKICPHKLITENKAGIFYDMIKKEYFLKYQTDKFLKEGK